jgi:hypothetical protein
VVAEMGANIEASDAVGLRPLHDAARCGHRKW